MTELGGWSSDVRFPYLLLTNGYYVCVCDSVFEAECADHIPIVKTSVAGTALVGRMTVGVYYALEGIGAQLWDNNYA